MGIIEDLTGGVQAGVSSVLASAETALSGLSPATAGVAGAVGGAIVGGGITGLVVSKISNKRKKSKSKSTRKRTSVHRKSKGRKLKFGSKAYRKKYLGKHRKQKQPHTAGKRKDTSHKRIRYTKHNQPYIILANGRARFIKKSSVTRARKLKGGRY